MFTESWLCCRCDCDAKRAEQKKSYQAEQADTGACRQPDKRGKPWTQCYQQNKNNRSCWHTGGETHRASVRRRKRSIWCTYVGAMFTLLTTSPCQDDGERESRRTVSYQLRNVVCNLCKRVFGCCELSCVLKQQYPKPRSSYPAVTIAAALTATTTHPGSDSV